ncbi:hypothetical protein [Natrialba sp. SSL1]|uniref:hypothetical protein n=1 Tax=Natrialba sp. SSL1 TaxID=1869245 RepID=UPI0011138601|nr:hypothetical protein [Natrialba sp. SSL1]
MERAVGGDVFAQALEETLPGWVGVEQGTLVLDLIGSAAMPTSRLVVTDDPPSSSALESFLQDVFANIHDRGVPAMSQLLLQPQSSSSQFSATIRVAELGAPNRPVGRHGLAASIQEPPACSLARVGPSSITSSRRLADHYWTTGVDGSDQTETPGLTTTDDGEHDTRLQASQTALEALRLRDSTHEYAALLDGQPACGPYEALPVEPTLELSADTLTGLLDGVPSYDGSHWPAGLTQFPPRLIRETVHREAAGTTHDDVLAGPHPAMTQLGIQPDVSLTEFTSGWLKEHNSHADQLEERSLGAPHFRGNPFDEDGPVVVVDPNDETSTTAVETAGELIMVANAAVRADSYLLVVTPTEEAAQWARRVLAVPYAARRGPHTVELYTVPDVVGTDSGGLLITERGSGEPYWSVSGGTQQALSAGDRCLGSGPVSEPLSSYSYDTPQLLQRGDSHIVLHQEGYPLETVSSLAACRDDYWLVRRPVLPVQPLFCAGVTVTYRRDSDLIEPIRSQSWDDEQALSPLEHHLKCALKRFIETYTVPISRGADGEASAFLEAFVQWYASVSTQPIPFLGMLTRLLPSEVAVRTDARGRPAVLENRRWWLQTEAIAHGCASPQSTDSNS